MKPIKILVFVTLVLATLSASRLDAASNQPNEKVTITGTVMETIQAQSYTYIKLKSLTGEVWAAIPQTTLKSGSTVTIQDGLPMHQFESKTLKRKFDLIYFGTLAGGNAPSASGDFAWPKKGAAPAPVASHHQSASSAIDLQSFKTPKSSDANAKTIAEVYAQKAALKGKPISVRGKVSKFTPAVMKKNWIHLSDGSGSVADKNYDLTVTTQTTVNAGDTITVSGTLLTDQDIGAGYQYPVLIENAKITK